MRQVQFISLIAVIFICCSYFNYESTYPIPSFVSFTNIKGPVNYRWEMRKSAWKSSLMNKYLAKVMHERKRSYRCISSTQKNEEWTLSYCLSTTLKVKKKRVGGGGMGWSKRIFENFLARSKFEQDFSCRKSTTLTSFDISRKNANFCTGAAVLVSCFT